MRKKKVMGANIIPVPNTKVEIAHESIADKER
jgi:hypothetical protein